MMETLIDLKKIEGKLNGKVIFLGTSNEEGRKPSGLELLIKKINYNAIIIGEPTNTDICVAEKGLVRIKIIAKGKAAHAAIGSKRDNAIYKAAKDLNVLSNLEFKKKHKLLNYPSIQATKVEEGGIAYNMIPDRCGVILDVRSTPIYSNNYLIKLIKESITSEVEIRSNRIFPKETDVKEKIVQAAKKAAPKSKIAGFMAVSDFAFVDKPGVILGAGSLKQAHSADEYIEISQLKKAVEVYKKTVINFFK